MKKLQFIIAAPHSRSFAKAVNSFLSLDVELANIKFIYNPRARFAVVVLSAAENKAWGQWGEMQQTFTENSLGVEDLGEVLKNIIR